jgi:antitoxin MazE
LPRDVAQTAGFTSGTSVEVEARHGEVVIRSAQPRYTLDELLEGVTPEAMRDAFRWGDDVGREAVE